ncbi:flagellar export chaperone FliS [Vibrio mediterranei]|uniref:flagellar export chaperone FliS n=1 Tax=Vibrio mediterranei TaxID=689 RepID=UPI0040698423
MLLGNSKNSQNSYKSVQVEANASVSSSFELVCMLHDKLVDCLDGMISAIERNDMEAKARNANKAIEVLSGLDASLDLSSGYDLVLNIHQLYEYSIATISECSVSKDIEKLESIKAIIVDLRTGWVGAMEILE